MELYEDNIESFIEFTDYSIKGGDFKEGLLKNTFKLIYDTESNEKFIHFYLDYDKSLLNFDNDRICCLANIYLNQLYDTLVSGLAHEIKEEPLEAGDNNSQHITDLDSSQEVKDIQAGSRNEDEEELILKQNEDQQIKHEIMNDTAQRESNIQSQLVGDSLDFIEEDETPSEQGDASYNNYRPISSIEEDTEVAQGNSLQDAEQAKKTEIDSNTSLPQNPQVFKAGESNKVIKIYREPTKIYLEKIDENEEYLRDDGSTRQKSVVNQSFSEAQQDRDLTIGEKTEDDKGDFSPNASVLPVLNEGNEITKNSNMEIIVQYGEDENAAPPNTDKVSIVEGDKSLLDADQKLDDQALMELRLKSRRRPSEEAKKTEEVNAAYKEHENRQIDQDVHNHEEIEPKENAYNSHQFIEEIKLLGQNQQILVNVQGNEIKNELQCQSKEVKEDLTNSCIETNLNKATDNLNYIERQKMNLVEENVSNSNPSTSEVNETEDPILEQPQDKSVNIEAQPVKTHAKREDITLKENTEEVTADFDQKKNPGSSDVQREQGDLDKAAIYSNKAKQDLEITKTTKPLTNDKLEDLNSVVAVETAKKESIKDLNFNQPNINARDAIQDPSSLNTSQNKTLQLPLKDLNTKFETSSETNNDKGTPNITVKVPVDRALDEFKTAEMREEEIDLSKKKTNMDTTPTKIENPNTINQGKASEDLEIQKEADKEEAECYQKSKTFEEEIEVAPDFEVVCYKDQEEKQSKNSSQVSRDKGFTKETQLKKGLSENKIDQELEALSDDDEYGTASYEKLSESENIQDRSVSFKKENQENDIVVNKEKYIHSINDARRHTTPEYTFGNSLTADVPINNIKKGSGSPSVVPELQKTLRTKSSIPTSSQEASNKTLSFAKGTKEHDDTRHPTPNSQRSYGEKKSSNNQITQKKNSALKQARTENSKSPSQNGKTLFTDQKKTFEEKPVKNLPIIHMAQLHNNKKTGADAQANKLKSLFNNSQATVERSNGKQKYIDSTLRKGNSLLSPEKSKASNNSVFVENNNTFEKRNNLHFKKQNTDDHLEHLNVKRVSSEEGSSNKFGNKRLRPHIKNIPDNSTTKDGQSPNIKYIENNRLIPIRNAEITPLKLEKSKLGPSIKRRPSPMILMHKRRSSLASNKGDSSGEAEQTLSKEIKILRKDVLPKELNKKIRKAIQKQKEILDQVDANNPYSIHWTKNILKTHFDVDLKQISDNNIQINNRWKVTRIKQSRRQSMGDNTSNNISIFTMNQGSNETEMMFSQTKPTQYSFEKKRYSQSRRERLEPYTNSNEKANHNSLIHYEKRKHSSPINANLYGQEHENKNDKKINSRWIRLKTDQ